MQQFTVPQFIDVEDKIIGPITSRQFVIMLAGFITMAIFYRIFDFSLFMLTGGIVLILTVVYSFVKINGRPFHFFTLNVIQTLKRASLRVWINEPKPLTEDEEASVIKNVLPPSEAEIIRTNSRLEELSLIVDTRGAYKGENKS